LEQLSITLPESLKTYLDSQVAAKGYDDASQFICALLCESQFREARDKVDALLIEGLDSGESAPMTTQDWQDLRREVQDRLARKGT
jgi:antitoxin ParD1/3/4